MEEHGEKAGLPISTDIVKPDLEDTFWVCLLGRGYPAPSSSFRWCTERLKIRNADRFILEKVSQYGEAIVLLGTRKDESGTRQQLMNLYEVKGSLLNRHAKFAQTYMYCPLKDFLTEDVWNFLLQNKNPWGENNRDLLTMYQEANASECPLVVDTSTPSCGGGRFGCWTCTVVTRDKSMDSLLEGGEDWLEPLAELREDLKRTQEKDEKRKVREFKRRNGKVMWCFPDKEGDDTSAGPYTLDFCKDFLRKLLEAQVKVRKTGPDPKMILINEDEIHEIQRIWRMERGDWKNSAFEIYERVCGEKLEMLEDLGGFGKVEQEILTNVCQENKVPQVLVSKLLHAEFSSQGMGKHSKVFNSLNKILSEEWRDDLNEIVDGMKKERDEKKQYR
jgi:DNA sulfur modification protein DndC